MRERLVSSHQPPTPDSRPAVRFGSWVAHALRERPQELTDLAALPPNYRADALFLLGADLSDVLVAYSLEQCGPDVVREAALAVAVIAGQLWLATVGDDALPSEGERDGR